MKKITLAVMSMCFSLAFYPTITITAANKAVASSIMVVNTPSETAETKALLKRGDKIDKTDKSDLKVSKKKALRKKVHSNKNKLKQSAVMSMLQVQQSLS